MGRPISRSCNVADVASVYDIALAALTGGRTLEATIATASLGKAQNRDAILAGGASTSRGVAVNTASVVMAVVVALGTISYQAIKAARANPVKSLRTN